MLGLIKYSLDQGEYKWENKHDSNALSKGKDLGFVRALMAT